MAGIGAGALFLVVYIAASSSLYFGLGMIAEQGLGLTPVVMLLAGVFFVFTFMSYVEGSSLHIERGGASSFARFAFDEFVSFVAGWAILLDYAIVLALVASAVPNYLAVFWSGFDSNAGRDDHPGRADRRDGRSPTCAASAPRRCAAGCRWAAST